LQRELPLQNNSSEGLKSLSAEIPISQRRETRAQIRFLVKVSGLDSVGNPFVQTAYARDVSRFGARIDGILCIKGPGHLINVQHGGKTAKCLVVWMGQPGMREHSHIGIRNLEPEKNIWGVKLPPASPDTFAGVKNRTNPDQSTPAASDDSRDTFEPKPARPNRRRYTRHHCVGAAEFRVAGNAVSMRGTVTDLSLGGCYVEASATCPTGSVLELVLEVDKVRLHTQGKVAVVSPTTGMGIEFIEVHAEWVKHLPSLIKAIRVQKS
jgi:hypothetical protein